LSPLEPHPEAKTASTNKIAAIDQVRRWIAVSLVEIVMVTIFSKTAQVAEN
jgi:hypothetical protein